METYLLILATFYVLMMVILHENRNTTLKRLLYAFKDYLDTKDITQKQQIEVAKLAKDLSADVARVKDQSTYTEAYLVRQTDAMGHLRDRVEMVELFIKKGGGEK